MATGLRTDVYEQRVQDVLSKEVVAVGVDDTVQDALNLMVENRVSALPVVNFGGACVGIVSSTDIIALTRDLNEELAPLRAAEFTPQLLMERLAEEDFARRRVAELMTEVVETVGPDALLVQAAREMLSHHVHRLPVVDRDGRLAGIVSTTDVLAAFVDSAPE